MTEESKQSLEVLIAQVAPPNSRLALLMNDFFHLAIAIGEAASALAAIKIREAAATLRIPAIERQKIDRQAAELNSQFLKNAIPFREIAAVFERELEELRGIARQNAQTAREEAERLRIERQIQLEAEKMSFGQVINAYGERLSINGEGQLVASRSAGFSDRDRIIIKYWSEKLIPILRERREVETI